MEEIASWEEKEANVTKFCQSVEKKIKEGLIMPTLYSSGSECEDEDTEEDDDWYSPVIVNEVGEVEEEWWD